MFFTPYDCGGLLGPLAVLSFKFRTFLARALVVRTFLEAPKAFLAITFKQSPLDYPKTTDPKISRRDKDQQKNRQTTKARTCSEANRTKARNSRRLETKV